MSSLGQAIYLGSIPAGKIGYFLYRFAPYLRQGLGYINHIGRFIGFPQGFGSKIRTIRFNQYTVQGNVSGYLLGFAGILKLTGPAKEI